MKSLTVDEFKAWAGKIHPGLFNGSLHLQTYGYWDNEPEYSGRWASPSQVVEFLTDSFTSAHYTLLGVSLLDEWGRAVAILSPDNQVVAFLAGDYILGSDMHNNIIPYRVEKVIVCTNGSVFYGVGATIADHGYFARDYVPAGEAVFYRRSWPNKVCKDCGRLYAGNPQQFDNSDCVYHG